jgi:hypothetical protein
MVYPDLPRSATSPKARGLLSDGLDLLEGRLTGNPDRNGGDYEVATMRGTEDSRGPQLHTTAGNNPPGFVPVEEMGKERTQQNNAVHHQTDDNEIPALSFNMAPSALVSSTARGGYPKDRSGHLCNPKHARRGHGARLSQTIEREVKTMKDNANTKNESSVIDLDEARKEKTMTNDAQVEEMEAKEELDFLEERAEARRQAGYYDALKRALLAETCWERTVMEFDLAHRSCSRRNWQDYEYARSLAAFAVVARQMKCNLTWLSLEEGGSMIIDNKSRNKSAIAYLSKLVYEFVRKNPDAILDDQATAPTFEELKALDDFEYADRIYGQTWRWAARYPGNMQRKIDEAFSYIKKHWLATLVIATELVKGHWFGPRMISRAMLHCLPDAINDHGDWLVFQPESFGLNENAYRLHEMENGSDDAYQADRLLIALHDVGYTLDGTCENKY